MIRFYFCLTLLTLIALPEKVVAHGASIKYREISAIAIQAKYDDGTPMANAQVVVYAPSNLADPWLKGVTDDEGNFSFVPDREAENIGNWDIKVRQAGHGDITSIPVGELQQANLPETSLASAGTEYSLTQKLVMASAVTWGAIGTALFFARSKTN